MVDCLFSSPQAPSQNKGTLGKWRKEVTHSLAHSDARDILQTSAMNTFFTQRVNGNPYNSPRFVGEGSDPQVAALRYAVLTAADPRFTISSREEDPLKCVVGTVDGTPSVELLDFLASPGLQVC